jgi:hypothetical protein
MDYKSVLRDSVETSVNMKFFKTIEQSLYAHIYKSKLVKIPLSKFKNINNFNPNRLQNSAVKAYPLENRPRGKDDISSVKFYQKLIQKYKNIQPIWMIKKDNKYTLLDGAHRIVASYIEERPFIYSYVINI